MITSSGTGPRFKSVIDAAGKMPQVEEISWEGKDGIWVYLRKGWINTQIDCHFYHEFTAADTVAAMRMYPPVKCTPDTCYETEHWSV